MLDLHLILRYFEVPCAEWNDICQDLVVCYALPESEHFGELSD